MSQTFEARIRRLPGAGDRIPPHDLIAEASLLGAMPLTKDALAAGAETCSPTDFYKPAHARIFEAILALDLRGEPADPTTPLVVDHHPYATVMEMRAKARRLRSRQGELDLIVVDYLQLMHTAAKAERRDLELAEISRGLKLLARDLDVPVLALSQLSRNVEHRGDKRPVLADLRESGAIEADATPRDRPGVPRALGSRPVRPRRGRKDHRVPQRARANPDTASQGGRDHPVGHRPPGARQSAPFACDAREADRPDRPGVPPRHRVRGSCRPDDRRYELRDRRLAA